MQEYLNISLGSYWYEYFSTVAIYVLPQMHMTLFAFPRKDVCLSKFRRLLQQRATLLTTLFQALKTSLICSCPFILAAAVAMGSRLVALVCIQAFFACKRKLMKIRGTDNISLTICFSYHFSAVCSLGFGQNQPDCNVVLRACGTATWREFTTTTTCAPMPNKYETDMNIINMFSLSHRSSIVSLSNSGTVQYTASCG